MTAMAGIRGAPAAAGLLVALGVAVASPRAAAAQEWETAAGWGALEDLPPGLHVIEADSTYRVSGFTFDDIFREMQRNGPGTDEIGTRLGLHVSEWRYSFHTRVRPGESCRLIDATVALRSTIILPEWTNVSTAPPAITRGWRPFIEALRRHEEGHRSLAQTHGASLWQALLGLEARDCDALTDLVEAVARRALEEGEAAQAAYDRDTGHGSTQGASWPPRP